MNCFHARRATLADNFPREIDFVMWRPNAGAELHYHVRGIGAEAINHLLDSVGNDAEFGAFAPGMNQPDSRGFLIDNVNRAAVGNVNAQDDAALIGNKSVAAGEFTAHRAVATTIDNLNFVPVNLLGGK